VRYGDDLEIRPSQRGEKVFADRDAGKHEDNPMTLVETFVRRSYRAKGSGESETRGSHPNIMSPFGNIVHQHRVRSRRAIPVAGHVDVRLARCMSAAGDLDSSLGTLLPGVV